MTKSRLAASVSGQQQKIEDLTARVIRLEALLEIALSRGAPAPQTRLIPPRR